MTTMGSFSLLITKDLELFFQLFNGDRARGSCQTVVLQKPGNPTEIGERPRRTLITSLQPLFHLVPGPTTGWGDQKRKIGSVQTTTKHVIYSINGRYTAA